MKANSRKRVLISSMCMLLVAIVALGTATYAWFTQDTVATTDNLGVRTAKTSSLQICSSTSSWDSTIDYKSSGTLLRPTSSYDAAKWYSAVAEKETAATALDGKATELQSISGYLFKDQLNIRNFGEVAVNDVEITFSLPTTDANYDYVRVALVPATGKGANAGFIDTPATDDGDAKVAFKDYVYANNATAYDAVKELGTGGVIVPGSITPQTADSEGIVTISVGDLGAATIVDANDESKNTYPAAFYNLYVWFEGQDPQCFNTNAGVTIPDIDFTVTGTPATETVNG